jgi:thioredoxin reductase (NADPH)
MKYDLIIIGAGPASLTAGIYAARYKLKTLIIGSLLGGTAGEAYEICNFPSYPRIFGYELMKKMIEQVRALNIEVKQESVKELKRIKNEFMIKTNKEEYSAERIIIATGSMRRRLGLKRENELIGRGVSYCATCDAGFYKEKTVIVIGGANAALSSALLLARFAKKIYIIHRGKEFLRAEPTLIDEVKKESKIKVMFNSEVTKLLGEKNVESVEINNSKQIETEGVFVEIGSIPITDLAVKLGVELDNGYIKVDKNQKTNVQGVYAAGDVTNNPLKQIVTACAEGSIAAGSVYKEVSHSEELPQ